jgi:thiamine biosynthesis lipoprotein
MSAAGPREHERSFDLLGSRVRLLVGPPADADGNDARLAALEAEAFLRSFHRRLTRFDPASELSRMNAAAEQTVAASPVLLAAVQAALWAAAGSGGLVDPTLVAELERTGYARSLVGRAPAPLREALAAAPARAPAAASPGRAWRHVTVDFERSEVTRPPGVRLDTGGIGKGLAADLCALRFGSQVSFAVDAGGDIQVGGRAPLPRAVDITHPLGGGVAHTLRITTGAVATSGISNRIWRRADGFAHHLLDPSTGRPAWTGVIQASALAESTVEAETLAKMAFLGGPAGARRVLEPQGGVLVLDDGSVEIVGAAVQRDPGVPGHASGAAA